MDISAVSPNISPAGSGAAGSRGEDAQIKALEQRLSQLEKEKRAAAQSKDTEKERRIEKQIQEIQRRIEQLRQKESEKAGAGRGQEPSGQDVQNSREMQLGSPGLGNYSDQYA